MATIIASLRAELEAATLAIGDIDAKKRSKKQREEAAMLLDDLLAGTISLEDVKKQRDEAKRESEEAATVKRAFDEAIAIVRAINDEATNALTIRATEKKTIDTEKTKRTRYADAVKAAVERTKTPESDYLIVGSAASVIDPTLFFALPDVPAAGADDLGFVKAVARAGAVDKTRDDDTMKVVIACLVDAEGKPRAWATTPEDMFIGHKIVSSIAKEPHVFYVDEDTCVLVPASMATYNNVFDKHFAGAATLRPKAIASIKPNSKLQKRIVKLM
jgi:hypothetical protein